MPLQHQHPVGVEGREPNIVEDATANGDHLALRVIKRSAFVKIDMKRHALSAVFWMVKDCF
jgi:hypothetical protein